MFLISLEYKVPFEEIEPHLGDHISFVTKYVESGVFLLTGRKIPRTGGVLLARVENREQLMGLLGEDPFMEFKLANFEITEFELSRVSPELLG
ncbi:YciI family protein [Mangrovibacterium diazotrophicum]|uniref:Uncharacterized protein YciI n=1 Tax=Mangrovibacterium diazotrophicum TaxID=1261403 RepID=A0A419VYU7_9BACT|nr:YciI family protein [Mangrovibacterium diazotrophicum]RKD88413.1 uncharacterized protein YciI [Mangrovibacterium diazotrophicum]